MKTSVIIQARMTSTRLPGKVLKTVLGRPLLELMIERLRRMTTIDEIIVATTIRETDDPVETLAKENGVGCFRGSEEDVLERVLQAAWSHHVDVIVETTGDCPLIDPVECDKVVARFRQGDCDYASNILDRTYPRGMDTQVFSTNTLEDVARRTKDPVDHEHVSFFIYQHPELYRLANVLAPEDCRRPDLRLTVDTEEDFLLVQKVFENFRTSRFSLSEIIQFLDYHPEIVAINREVPQKEVLYGQG